MNPAMIIAWMAAIEQLLVAAPNVIAFATRVQSWVDDLFFSKLITTEQQADLMNRVNIVVAARLTGNRPPHWRVEPDPEPTKQG